MGLWYFANVLVSLIAMAGVAFITLLERKYLGLSQIRLGPNKLTLSGILQPLADGVKLMAKQLLKSGLSQSILFIMSPLILLMIFLLIWTSVLLWDSSSVSVKWNALVLFVLLGVSTYGVIMSGWATMSSFSKLGSLRGVLQSLSYEVALILIFMALIVKMDTFFIKPESVMGVEFLLVSSLIWIILSLMETNRAPFDLLEGESELISGFNIEMGSLLFIYLFLSEYGMIMVMGLILALITNNSLGTFGFMVASSILLVRSCYPRVRYDIVMTLMWQMVLPLSLTLLYLHVLSK